MAVPKKRTSVAKRRARFANWKNKAKKQATKALSLAKSILNESNQTSFIYTNSRLNVSELEKVKITED